MVLNVAEALASSFFPTQYIVHIVVGIVVVLTLHAVCQGRRTTRERDLHARTVLITGGFTPLGLTILRSLAQRGAHIIALSPDPIDSANITILISLLRTTTSNEQIFAEECDVSSPASIRSFCTRFLTGQDQRIDAIILAHEYHQIGSFFSRMDKEKERNVGSLATFLITTLLLPALLVAPVERDIRIINVVNPFYAAAATLLPLFDPPKERSVFLREGIRSLRSIIVTRHLQRILDALPAAQIPKPEEGSSSVPVVNTKAQKSNIVAVSVCPGISRVDTVSALFNADWMIRSTPFGIALYIILQPILRIFFKSPERAMQSVLHALFLPTPFKVPVQPTQVPDAMPEEVLKPGALYRECAVVTLKVSVPEKLALSDPKVSSESSLKGKGKGKAGEEVLEIPDDGEYGGEVAGRLVWEAYEEALKVWEKENPASEQDLKREEERKREREKVVDEVSPY
ncbi:uncharacterized protein LACBIDRAFT_298117 [Laccaria bicolor S238N-H82]|uniref:Predicted protein n=1 Tax=Laccaria bicolor (strain S238N-H82 / ATCC MYA-4686) TaxID=486041 RepID=B0DCA4_LACBS|nr:uncharacterized protein LACBIDRAFT_298117 [Laccaria bicolor S238N-H82]EDR07697.1 predicted protein [Laccaria bicolor S238N-H82]|eukprot:XP_001881486.1 predicted protein [Laccaria bicolor S238N-H82]